MPIFLDTRTMLRVEQAFPYLVDKPRADAAVVRIVSQLRCPSYARRSLHTAYYVRGIPYAV